MKNLLFAISPYYFVVMIITMLLTQGCGGAIEGEYEGGSGSGGVMCISIPLCKAQCEANYDYDLCLLQAAAGGVSPSICDGLWYSREDCYDTPQ